MAKGKVKSERVTVKEPFLMLLAKSAMAILFAWSGFFWSGVTIINFYMLNAEYAHLATRFLIGSVLLLISLVLCFARIYILQLPFMAAGLIPFLMAANEMIDVSVATGVEYTPSFELRYMPIVAFAILSVALAMVKIWQIIAKRTEAKNEFNNSPSKSILD